MSEKPVAKKARPRQGRPPVPPRPRSSSPLAVWRARTGTSQQALGEHLGVGASLVSDWEQGINRPKLELALEIEAISKGHVPIESFGYAPPIVELILGFRPNWRVGPARTTMGYEDAGEAPALVPSPPADAGAPAPAKGPPARGSS